MLSSSLIALVLSAQAAGAELLVTADRGGALVPCAECPASEALGGAARMASVVRERRDAGPVLLVDAGNALFGSADAVDDPGLAVRDLLAWLEYDAINVAYTDFRHGAEATRTLLADLPAVSANLLGASGAPLFAPWIVREVGGERYALVGVTMEPAGLAFLPHLRRQLEGVRIADPLATLEAVLPAARAEADRVVLLAYADRALLASLSERFAHDLDAIAVGGLRPGELPPDAAVPLVAVERDGHAIADLPMDRSRPARSLVLGPDVPRDEEVAAWLDPRLARPPREAPRVVRLPAVWSAHAAPTLEPRHGPAPGPLAAAGPRRATVAGLTMSVDEARLVHALEGGSTPSSGMHFSVDVELELSPGSEPLTIASRDECFFAVLDRRRVLPARSVRTPGELPARITLVPGKPVAGRLVFDLPRAAFASLSLEFSPPGRGGRGVDLVDAPPLESPFDERETPACTVQLLGFEARESFEELVGDPGHAFVIVAVRVRRGVGAPPGPWTWHRLSERMQLVLDGLRPFSPASAWEDPWTIPCSDHVGGRAVFRIPRALLASAASAELVCPLEPMERAGESLERRLPLRFSLVGERVVPQLPEEGARLVTDEVITHVEPVAITPTYAGRSAADGALFAATHVWLAAPAGRGLQVDPRRRFAAVDAGGNVFAPSPLAWSEASPSPSGAPFWVPAGGVRRLPLAFELPAAAIEGLGLLSRGLLRADVVPIGTSDAAALPAADPERSTRGARVFTPERTSEGLAGVGLTPDAVNEAIDRGSAFLWSDLKSRIERREPFDRTKLPAILALVHCGMHERETELAGALREWLPKIDVRAVQTYGAGLLALVLDARDESRERELYRSVLRHLIEGQGPGGTWTYLPHVPDRSVAESGPLLRRQGWHASTDGDNSISQYAVLALGTAERHGIAVDPDVWRNVLEAFTARQGLAVGDDFGGWGYTDRGAYGSMVCAGIVSTAIALRRLDPECDPRADLRIRDALAWLDANWTVAGNPRANAWHYYHLYGLERVGRLLGTEWIGAHEWYPEGARWLLSAQRPDGSWSGTGHEADPRLATSFALLFLRRTTRSLELDGPEEVSTEPGLLETRMGSAAGRTSVYVILDASGSMLTELGGRRKFDLARDAVRRLVEALPAGTPVALRAYGHRKRAIEDGADEDTELLVPFGSAEEELPAALERLRARGKTPLALSLEHALRDVSALPAGERAHVVLLTDGGEDTRRDPVEAARAFATRPTVTLSVVGFDVDRSRWTPQLVALAGAATGTYLAVDAAEELAATLANVVAPSPPEFTVLDAAGEPVASGRFGDDVPLAAGDYALVSRRRGIELRREFRVRPGGRARVALGTED